MKSSKPTTNHSLTPTLHGRKLNVASTPVQVTGLTQIKSIADLGSEGHLMLCSIHY